MQEGVKGDIHTLSNAVEADNSEVVWLILENNPALIDEYFHARYEDALKHSVRYVSRTATQEAAYNLQEEVFLVLLKYNPNTKIRTPLGDTIASILKHKELAACYSKISLDEFNKENDQYHSDCQKAKRMMSAFLRDRCVRKTR